MTNVTCGYLPYHENNIGTQSLIASKREEVEEIFKVEGQRQKCKTPKAKMYEILYPWWVGLQWLDEEMKISKIWLWSYSKAWITL